jgi:ubiquinone biosynthesis protein
MLQKTLLNIEGLGRDLDPNIDLWQTAKPFLKRWMSEQLGWRSVLKNIKKELPYITKDLPQMPRLVHQFLTQQTSAEQNAPFRLAIDELVKTQQKQARWQKRLTLAVSLLIFIQLFILLKPWLLTLQ